MKKRLFAVVAILFIASTITSCGGGGDKDITYPFTVKLIKTDGTEIETTDRPIPLGTKIQLTFEESILEETVRNSIVAALSLLGPGSTEVDGTWIWNGDSTKLTFTPTKRFDYQTVYRLTATATDTTTAATKGLEEGSYPFTTMTRSDLNGDGYADLALGAYLYSAGASTYEGALYIFDGSASGIQTTYTKRLIGDDADDHLGIFWDFADVNGDGYEDLLISDSNNDDGAVHIYHGSASGIPDTPNRSLVGQTKEYFGVPVAGGSDVNGDGFDDIIIGAPGHAEGAVPDIGAAYVYHGSADGIPASPTTTLLGENSSDQFGFQVAARGDVNGDGYGDMMVCTPEYDANSYGKVYVYLGMESGLNTTPAFTHTGTSNNEALGYPCRFLGDVNGDGYDDIGYGTATYNANDGRATIFYGSTAGINATPVTITPPISAGAFGFLERAGDVNGDGFDDIVVGAPRYDNLKGAAYVYHGAASGISTTPSNSWTQTSKQAFGIADPPGDYNGDGYSDVVVGAPAYDNDAYRGAAYISYGSASGSADSFTMLVGENDGDEFGSYVVD